VTFPKICERCEAGETKWVLKSGKTLCQRCWAEWQAVREMIRRVKEWRLEAA
jgi:hypothetical protein